MLNFIKIDFVRKIVKYTPYWSTEIQDSNWVLIRKDY